jgi:hypothetical protein
MGTKNTMPRAFYESDQKKKNFGLKTCTIIACNRYSPYNVILKFVLGRRIIRH